MKLEAKGHRSYDEDTLYAIIDFLSHRDELRESEIPLDLLDAKIPDVMFWFATHLQLNFKFELRHEGFPSVRLLSSALFSLQHFRLNWHENTLFLRGELALKLLQLNWYVST